MNLCGMYLKIPIDHYVFSYNVQVSMVTQLYANPSFNDNDIIGDDDDDDDGSSDADGSSIYEDFFSTISSSFACTI